MNPSGPSAQARNEVRSNGVLPPFSPTQFKSAQTPDHAAGSRLQLAYTTPRGPSLAKVARLGSKLSRKRKPTTKSRTPSRIRMPENEVRSAEPIDVADAAGAMGREAMLPGTMHGAVADHKVRRQGRISEIHVFPRHGKK